jgi:hypothetical protein
MKTLPKTAGFSFYYELECPVCKASIGLNHKYFFIENGSKMGYKQIISNCKQNHFP